MRNITWIKGRDLAKATGEDGAAYDMEAMFPILDGDPRKVDWRLYHETRHKKIGESFGSDKPAPTYQELLTFFGIDADQLQTLCEADAAPSPNYYSLLRMWMVKQGVFKAEAPKGTAKKGKK